MTVTILNNFTVVINSNILLFAKSWGLINFDGKYTLFEDFLICKTTSIFTQFRNHIISYHLN